MIGWIFGIISAVTTIKGYFGQKKMEKAYISVLEQAKLDWEGKYTEEQIRELTEQFNILRKQIQNDIPRHAKRVLLENQLNNITQSIAMEYQKYNQISSEMKELVPTIELEQPIRKAIENEIMPNYVGQQRQQRGTQMMLLVILVISIAPFFMQVIYSFFYDYGYFKFLPIQEGDIIAYIGCTFISLSLVFLYIPFKYKQVLLNYKLKSILLSGLLIIVWIFTLYLVIYEPISLPRVIEVIGSIISLAPFSIGIWILYTMINGLMIYKNTRFKI